MFSNTKSSFGTPSSNTSFGFSSNVTSSPFAQTTFGKPVTSSFGTPSMPFASGTSATTFGQPAQTKPSFPGGMFGTQNTQSAGAGMFGSANTSVFGQQNKPPGFGFGSSTSSRGFFGPTNSVQPQQATSGVFGQNTSNIFGNASGFGVGSTQIGTPTKFTPVASSDTVFRGGISQTVNTRHQCITFMKEYEKKSLEELRWEDYQVNRKQGNQPTTGLFSNTVQSTQNIFGPGAVSTSGGSIFGQTDNKGIFGGSAQTTFGQSNTAFGTVSSVSSSVPFGKPTTGFGATPNNTSSFTFNTNPPQQVNLFGSNTSGTLFSKTSQPSNIFGQPTSGFGTQSNLSTFGTNTNQNAFAGLGQSSSQNISLFSGTNTTGITGFTNTATPSLFAQPTLGQTNQNLFGSTFNKPVSTLFGQTNTSNSLGNVGTGTSIFSNTSNKQPNMFNNNLGIFNSGLGMANMNNMNVQTGVNNSYQNQMNAEQQILYMSATPYGITKLLNNVTEVNNDLKDITRFTNTTELNTLLNTVCKSSSEASFDKLEPVHILSRKLPEFDGLEEKDHSLVSNFRISNNRKHLMLRLKNVDEKSSRTETNSIGPESKSLLDVSKNIESNFPLEYTVIKNLRESESFNRVSSPIPKDTSIIPVLTQNQDEVEEEQEVFSEARESVEWEEDKSKSVENKGKSRSSTEAIWEPHPTGIVLTRSEYYTMPSLEDLLKFISPDGTCLVKGFTVGRVGYGNIYFPDSFDVSNLDLDDIVHIRHKEVNIYPDDSKKPPLGQGLNRRAQVTLDNVWPYDKNLKKLITDIDTLNKIEYPARLRRLCEKQNTHFIEYRPDTGSWVFKVEHFSKYNHQDSDDSEDEILLKKPTQLNSPFPIKYFTDSSSNIHTTSQKMDVHTGIFNNPFQNCNLGNSMELIQKPELSQDVPRFTYIHFEYIKKKSCFDKTNKNDDIFIDNPSVDDGILKLETFKYQNDFEASVMKDYDTINNPTVVNPFTDLQKPFFNVSSGNIELIKETIPFGVLPFHMTRFGESDIADIVMFKGRSFKVGWGKGLSFTYITTYKNVYKKTMLQNRYETGYSSGTVQVISLQSSSVFSKYIFEDELESLLTNQLLMSEYNIEYGIPHFKSSLGSDLLAHHKNSLQNKSKTSYLRQVWDLCDVLWGKLKETDLTNHTKNHIRRKKLSAWLQDVVEDEIYKNLHTSEEKTYEMILQDIFTYVSGNKLEEAALIAFNSNDLRLSLLIPLLSTNLETKGFIYKQLEEWNTSKTCNHINKTLLKLYMLLAGKPLMKCTDQWVHVCEDLDWLRTLGIFLWFLVDPVYPIKNAIEIYEETYVKGMCTKAEDIYDLRYQLLKLYSETNYPLEKVLNSTSYTDDPFDYTFSWLILQVLSSFGYNISKEIQLHIHMNFAAQLERIGYWHWAIFVLLFIDDHYIKKRSVQNVIDRNIQIMENVSPEYLKKEEILLQQFRIPSDWIDSAKFAKMGVPENV